MNDIPFKKLLGTTDKFVRILEANGIRTPTDLLRYLPRTYEDRSVIKTLAQVTSDTETQVVKGKIIKKSMIRTPRGKQLIELTFTDENEQRGHILAMHSSFLLRTTKTQERYYIIGKVAWEQGKHTFRYPTLIEAKATDEGQETEVGRIYPIYPEMMGIKSPRFAKRIQALLPQTLSTVSESLPAEFLQQYDLPDLQTTLRSLHYAESFEQINQAKRRLFFERMLRIQLLSLDNKQAYQENGVETTSTPDRERVKTFIGALPFELTHAQKRCIKEIIDDITSPKPMLRLLQGDVGSGKTIVAAIAALYTILLHQGQVAFLAPLEVLAQQHHRSLAKLLLPLGIRSELLTGSTTTAEKQRIKQGLQQGTVQLVVGTHALLQEDVSFNDLQLAVIDEQHKFGVRQRAVFQRHGSPHILQMTATPIPRSLALAFFGEFEVSTIDEMPAGRKPIITKIVSEAEFTKMKPWVLTKIGQDQKVFAITPLIEESEALDEVKAATQHYEELQHLYPELRGKIGLLHGKMRSADKDAIMHDFKTGKYVFLVSTTVIEVGIDIAEATIMIIFNAERFGLSQLHQLRGRVGRSDVQSYCFLETKHKSGDTYQRLKHMENTTDGFKLAEIDLQFRGPGDFLGVRQAGETDIPMELLTDTSFLITIQEAAHMLLQTQPQERLHQYLYDGDKNSRENLLV